MFSHQRNSSEILTVGKNDNDKSSLLKKISFLSEKIDRTIEKSEVLLQKTSRDPNYLTNHSVFSQETNRIHEDLKEKNEKIMRISQKRFNLMEKMEKIKEKTGFDMEILIEDIFSLTK